MRGSAAALIGLGAAVLFCPTAHARSDDPEEAAEALRPRRHRSAQILLDMNDAPRGEREEGGHFQIRKRYGLEYSHRFDSKAGPPLIFSIQGPAMPQKKRFGLSFEIRF